MAILNEDAKTFRVWPDSETMVRADGARLLLVGTDPSSYRYSDADSEAMDCTNWNAVLEDLTTYGDDECEHDGWMFDLPGRVDTLADLAAGRGTWMVTPYADMLTVKGFHSTLRRGLVIVEGSPAWDCWEKLAKALSDYPLLDEDAYLKLEWEAWQEYAANGFGFDVWRDNADEVLPIVNAWADRHDVDNETRQDLVWWIKEAVQDQSSDIGTAWQSVFHATCSYYEGFGGEYEKDAAREAVLGTVGGMLALCDATATAGYHWHLAAMGHATLPFTKV